MAKPEHTKPFNLEHAKAGAPFSCDDGGKATVFHWGEKKLIGMKEGARSKEHAAAMWDREGCHMHGEHWHDLVMRPLGYVEGRPVFVGDELISKLTGCLVVVPPNWSDVESLRWPKLSPLHPQTKMTDEELLTVAHNKRISGTTADEHRASANAAIARAIQDGDVVPVAALGALAADVWDSARLSSGELPPANSIAGRHHLGVIIKTVNPGEFVPTSMLEKVARTTMDRCKQLLDLNRAEDPFAVRGRTIPGWITIDDEIAAIIERVKGGAA